MEPARRARRGRPRRAARGRARRPSASAAAGQPRSPSTVATSPSFASAPAVWVGVLGMVDQRQPEHARVGERVAEQRRGLDRRAVVARTRRRRRRPARRARQAAPPPARGDGAVARAGARATRTRPRRRARRARTAASSIGGVVLGIAQTVVNPPWAAAARPDATVSAASLPGSRRWAWRSMKPGRDDDAAVVDPVGLAARRATSTASRTPSRTTISPGPSRPAAGSTSQAREISRSATTSSTRSADARVTAPSTSPRTPASRYERAPSGPRRRSRPAP